MMMLIFGQEPRGDYLMNDVKYRVRRKKSRAGESGLNRRQGGDCDRVGGGIFRQFFLAVVRDWATRWKSP